MTTLGYTILIIYNICLVFVFVYCLMQLHLLYVYIKNGNATVTDSIIPYDVLPRVTIQLPIYNEKYVVERLIDNIIQLDYPKDLIDIQILDDSTDDTLALSTAKATYYREQGYDIHVITRKKREGYKAGALQHGMQYAKGEFIAIFDADFLPQPDFIHRCLPHLRENVAAVQTRWGHINEGYNILTRLQAFQLNVHFSIEQGGRWSEDLLLQFNGTAGIWRRTAIEDAGGWKADTLTEDLDLSYRAQLKGWKIVYQEEIASPAELPIRMSGLKSQQYRWMKGGAESARKLLPSIWKSELNMYKKTHATLHLLSSTVYIAAFLLGVLSVPMLFLGDMGIHFDGSYMSVFISSTIILAMIYYYANVERLWSGSRIRNVATYILIFPVFLALSMGLSLHNSIAVIQGYWGKKTAFIRTPKFNILDNSYKAQSSYQGRSLSYIAIWEGILSAYFLTAIIYRIHIQNLDFIVFHIVFFVGYLVIFLLSITANRSTTR